MSGHQVGQDQKREDQRKHESGRDFKEGPRTQDVMVHVMRRDEEYVRKKVMGIEVQRSRRRGRPKKRWVDCVKDDPREKGLSGEEVYDRGDYRSISTPHRSGIKMEKKSYSRAPLKCCGDPRGGSGDPPMGSRPPG